jgi:hypothetical protein
MSKINLPFWLQDYASQGLRYVGNPNIEVAPSSGKDDVKRTATWYASYAMHRSKRNLTPNGLVYKVVMTSL